MAATRTTLNLGVLFLCFHFGLMVTQKAINPSDITVDCSGVSSNGQLKDMSITLPNDYKPVFVDKLCKFAGPTAADKEKQNFKVAKCDKPKMLLIVVNTDFDASSRILTRNASEFTVSCIDGETNIATASLQSATIPTIEVHPKVSLKLLDSPPSETNVGVQGNPDAKYSYGRDLYLTFEHENANSVNLDLIPLDCSAEGHTHPAVTLFNTNASSGTKCVQQTSVMTKPDGGNNKLFTTSEIVKGKTTAVTYAKFKVFSFVEPSPTVTISCTVRVCYHTMITFVGGKCKEDSDKMKACTTSSKRRRRDVNGMTRMTGGQEHGQVHRVTTSYSIQENLRATGGSNMISRTFSLLLASILILFL